MSNQRGYGRDSEFQIKRESSQGVDPNGNFVKLPYLSTTLGLEQGQLDSPRAGVGRTPKETFKDAPSIGGNLVMPVCLRSIGYLLTGLLGNPSTTNNAGVYTHVFSSETAALPSYAMQVGFPSVPKYDLNLGCMVNSMEVDMTRAGPASLTFGLLGMTQTRDTSTQGGTATSQTTALASNFQGFIKQNDSIIANLSNFKMTYSNGLIGAETLNQSGNLEGIDPGQVSVTGSFSTRFANASNLNAAIAGTPIDLEFGWQISSDLKLTFEQHEVYLDVAKPPVDGPGGISLDLNYKAIYNTSNTALLTATLINNLAGTTYTS